MPKRWLPAVVMLLFAACGDSTGLGANQGRFDFADPAGDTVASAGSADTLPALDALEMGGSTDRDTLVLTLRFAEPVSSGDQAPNSVVALLEVDADADTATGIPALTDPFPRTAQMGVDYYIFIPGDSGSGAEVQNIATQSSTEYPASYGATSVTVRVPLEAIGAPQRTFRVVGLVGTPQRPTDLLPNTGSYTIVVPSAATR